MPTEARVPSWMKALSTSFWIALTFGSSWLIGTAYSPSTLKLRPSMPLVSRIEPSLDCSLSSVCSTWSSCSSVRMCCLEIAITML